MGVYLFYFVIEFGIVGVGVGVEVVKVVTTRLRFIF